MNNPRHSDVEPPNEDERLPMVKAFERARARADEMQKVMGVWRYADGTYAVGSQESRGDKWALVGTVHPTRPAQTKGAGSEH